MPSSKPEVSMSKISCDLLQLPIAANSSGYIFQAGFTNAENQKALRIVIAASQA
jgi:hypothetical protein